MKRSQRSAEKVLLIEISANIKEKIRVLVERKHRVESRLVLSREEPVFMGSAEDCWGLGVAEG